MRSTPSKRTSSDFLTPQKTLHAPSTALRSGQLALASRCDSRLTLLVHSLLGAELAAQNLNFPAQLSELTAAAGAVAPPFLPAVLEDDGGCAAADGDDDDALGALAASMHRFLTERRAPSSWIPAVQLPPPLVLRPATAAAVSAPLKTSEALLHPPHAAAAAAARAAVRRAASSDSGPGWFNLAAPAVTPELKRDLRLLRLRGAFDPKRFYKSADTGRLPEHFAVR